MSCDIGTEKIMQSRARDGDQEICGQGSVHRIQEGEQEARGRSQESSSMSRDQSLISNSERAFRGVAIKYGRDAERAIRTGKQDLQSIAKSAERRPQGDFRRDYRSATELLNRTDGQSLVNDVRKGEHHLESGFEHVANWAERELPSITIRQELRIGQHDVENGVKGAVRSVTSDLPGLDVRGDVRRGQRDLQNGLRRLDPENMVRDVQ